MSTEKPAPDREPGWLPSGRAAPARRGPKREWHPGDEKPTGPGRRAKLAALLAAAAVLIAAGVALYLWITRPSPPALILVTADPGPDFGLLDAPVDPYGWKSGQALKAWAERNYQAAGDDKSHSPKAVELRLARDEQDPGRAERQLAERIEKAIERNCKTAVVYFGLHTGADQRGPFLFAAGGLRLRVLPLLKEIGEGARRAGATAVVLFDNGRLPPRPESGQLADGFARALTDQAKDIPENVAVVLGAKDGVRGRESEEWQTTALARSVIEGLSGKIKLGNLVDAKELVEHLEKDLPAVTGKLRPTAQTPVLLSAGKDLKEVAIAPAVRLEPVKPTDWPGGERYDSELAKTIGSVWENYSGLARRAPPPTTYAPRRWRRYRELLLRYEYLARAGATGEAGAAGELLKVLKAEADALGAAAPSLVNKSRTASVPAWRSAGGTLSDPPENVKLAVDRDKFDETFRGAFPPDRLPDGQIGYSDYAVGRLVEEKQPGPTTLGSRANLLRAAWKENPVRPPDAQLALMLDRFYRELVKEPLPVGLDPKRPVWQQAVEVRRLAEEAAVGQGKDYLYSEAVWPFVRAEVEAADKARREGEDLLFGPAAGSAHKDAADKLTKAEEGYKRANEIAERIRPALAVRDEVYAELPFIGRWLAAEPDADKAFDDLVGLWGDVHDLARVLDQPPAAADLDQRVDTVRRKYRALRKVYDDRSAPRDDTNLQLEWAKRERRLAVPPAGQPDVDKRIELIRTNRKSTRSLEGALDARRAGLPDQPVAPGVLAGRLGGLAVAELGKDLLDRQKRPDLPGESAIIGAVANLVAKGNDKEGDWQAAAKEAGDRIGTHYAALAGRPDPKPADPEADRHWAERASRVAVGFTPAGEAAREPAQVNRDWRWRRLLAGLGRRAVLDHWYDTGGGKYFEAVADAYLADALAPATGGPPDLTLAKLLDDAAEVQKLRDAPGLGVSYPGVRPIRWTTEPEVSVAFELVNRDRLPAGARPVAWAGGSPPAAAKVVISPAGAARSLLDPVPPELKVTAAADTATTAKDTFAVGQSLFLRGQVATASVTVKLVRTPDLVYTQVQTDLRPQVAFVGPDDIQPGYVSIVIDYSASMGDLEKDPKKPPKSRIDRALRELETFFDRLPAGTELSIRVFGVKHEQPVEALGFELADGMTIKTKDRRVVGPGRPVNWKDARINLENLMGELRAVAQAPAEEAASPIVRAMVHAAEQDFPRGGAERPRVLLVLTDGEDNSRKRSRDDPLLPEDKEVLKKVLTARVRPVGAVVRVVMIDDSRDDATYKQVRDQFAEALGEGDDAWGSVERVLPDNSLADRLVGLLRPQVHLAATEGPYRASVRLKYPSESLEWGPDKGGLPGSGVYVAKVGSPPDKNRPQDQRIEFAPGDRLLVRLSRDGVRMFERVPWGKWLAEGGRPVPTQPAGGWVTTVAGYRARAGGFRGDAVDGTEYANLDVLAAVESADPGAGEAVQQLAPGVAWWELDLPDLREPRYPVYVWREYGHPAPAWRVRRPDWLGKNNERPAVALRGWAADRLQPAAQFQPAPARTAAGKLPDGRGWRATVGEADHGFVRSGDTAERTKAQRCLAVRVYLDDPKGAALVAGQWAPVYARVKVNGRHPDAVAEHQFFKDDGAYTGYFAVPPDQAPAAEVELYSVGDLKLRDGKPRPGAEVKLPEPKGEDPNWPLPVLGPDPK